MGPTTPAPKKKSARFRRRLRAACTGPGMFRRRMRRLHGGGLSRRRGRVPCPVGRGVGQADAQRVRVPVQCRFGLAGGAGMVARVVALQHVLGQREIARRAREGPNVVEAVDEGEGPAARQPAIGRFQAEDAAERRRHPERAVGVRAERNRREARRRGGAGSYPVVFDATPPPAGRRLALRSARGLGGGDGGRTGQGGQMPPSRQSTARVISSCRCATEP